MELTSIASSSEGNAIFVGTKETKLLAGLRDQRKKN